MNFGFLTIGILYAAMGCVPPAEDGLTADQFFRLIRAQQSAIHDVAFAYEGDERSTGAKDEKGIGSISYQGRYALRSDGASFLETYDSFNGRSPDKHFIQTIINGRGEKAPVTPQFEKQANPPSIKSSAGPGSFFNSRTPETFMFLWRFQTLKGPADFGFKFLGWEDVDGHRCAHVEFDPYPNIPDRVIQELWVDLERGAHPLKIRNSHNGETVYTIDQIHLEQFPTESDGKLWFPVGGRFNKHHEHGKYTKDPVSQSTMYILNNTLVFNQGLSDQVFQIKGERFRPAFAAKTSKISTPTKPKQSGFDHEDAEKKLDVALADPARKKLAKDANLATRAESSGSSLLYWGLLSGGTFAVLIAGVVAFRRR